MWCTRTGGVYKFSYRQQIKVQIATLPNSNGQYLGLVYFKNLAKKWVCQKNVARNKKHNNNNSDNPLNSRRTDGGNKPPQASQILTRLKSGNPCSREVVFFLQKLFDIISFSFFCFFHIISGPFIWAASQLKCCSHILPAKILSPFLCTAPLPYVLKMLFAQASIDCLINNKTKNALNSEAVILNYIGGDPISHRLSN